MKVVDDEISSPTYARDLAGAILALIEQHPGAYGTYHFTGGGQASRYEYAKKILELTGRSAIPIERIKLSDFVRAAKPPHYSVLHNTAGAALGIIVRPWEEALEEYLKEGMFQVRG
ncbi:MAG: hypothetical protein NVS9B9_27770 [Ktedonobacteraceae bacterium]